MADIQNSQGSVYNGLFIIAVYANETGLGAIAGMYGIPI